jgi:GxxExxY protein
LKKTEQEEEKKYLHSDDTGTVLKAFYSVYNQLGHGFSERIYKEALSFDLRELAIKYEQEKPIKIYYSGIEIGEEICDFVVNSRILVEIECKPEVSFDDENRLLNLLKSSDYEVGLLLNFGKIPHQRRKIFTNNLKSRKSENLE